MKKLFHIGILFVIVSSCSNDKKEVLPTETIYELVQSRTDLDSLAKYLELYTELTDFLKADSSNTLFAPDNNAFVSLLLTIGTDDLSSIHPVIMKALLSYHIVPRQAILQADLSGSLNTLNGEIIKVNANGTLNTYSSNSEIAITTGNILATNGVIHIIEMVLIPHSIHPPPPNKLSQPIMLAADFTTLAKGIVKADEFAIGASKTTINSILSGTDVYTVFAPPNISFDTLSITIDSFTGQQWYEIIMNHIVPGIVNSTDLTTCAELITASGDTLVVFNDTTRIPATNGLGIYFDSNGDIFCDLSDGGTSLNDGLDAELVLEGVFIALNGKLNVIAGVLIP